MKSVSVIHRVIKHFSSWFIREKVILKTKEFDFVMSGRALPLAIDAERTTWSADSFSTKRNIFVLILV